MSGKERKRVQMEGRNRAQKSTSAYKLQTTQRAENMGLDSVVVGFRVLGAPRFSVQSSQNPLKQLFWDLRTENRGAPKARNPTMTL